MNPSKSAFKAVLLYHGNEKPSIPVGHPRLWDHQLLKKTEIRYAVI